MTVGKSISVAMPWSLSHYILSNGFHPIYRALVDHAPSNITLNAWDNVKLYERLRHDNVMRVSLLSAATQANLTCGQLDSGTIANEYCEYFWPPNQVLTGELAGEIEFHHTAPFPSLRRPFVFHCESFAPVFLPFFRQGGGDMGNHIELRQFYRNLFANPLCLGIFSHIPETLASFRQFFSDPTIDAKLFFSRVGISSKALEGPDLPAKRNISKPRFLFVNSANQNPENFFLRGGHIVLRFWNKFRTDGRDGLLVMRCRKPDAADLSGHGVDQSFMDKENGRSIIWAEDYIANHEMNAVMASAHFFLLPSASLHSASIMQAMSLGTIPVVSDTVGTSVYVTDDDNGIMLQGVRSARWHTDPNTGVQVDRYDRTHDFDDALAIQMFGRILGLVDAPDEYEAMRQRALVHSRKQFSGAAFGAEFWWAVSELYRSYQQVFSPSMTSASDAPDGLSDCLLCGERWANVFEGATQPIQRIHTGETVVTELGGATVLTYGVRPMRLNDWSVLAQFWVLDAPRLMFANSINELGGTFLAVGGRRGQGLLRKMTRFVSKLLMPYPELHSFAASILKKLRRQGRLIAFGIARGGARVMPSNEHTSNRVGSTTPALVVAGYYGFNIIRLEGRFHAILQGEGAFELARLEAKNYSRSFSGPTLIAVQGAILASLDAEGDTTDAGSRRG
jgi:glycosyltransferase involved in cell wall biosynthesis